MDSGAECSIISSGLIQHLKLLEQPDTKAYASDFTVSGYDRSANRQMPIVSVWIRLGTRGDDLRWDKVMFVVLPTKDYKLILGMDVLENRKGIPDISGRKM